MPTFEDEDLMTYSRQETTQAEYDEMRAREIAADVMDTLENLTCDIQLAIENKPYKALKKALWHINESIALLSDVDTGAAD